ncbi:MAG: ABC transporter substrate-binding protein [Solirubrobacteraceae bacterium]
MYDADHDARGITRRDALKGTLALSFAAMSGGALAACGGGGTASAPTTAAGKPRRGGTLTVAISNSSKSETLDPATPTVSSEYVLLGLVYDSLTRLSNDDWKLSPGLAESWEPNADLTQWTLKLRPGVTFHDGRPLTADDVVWSLRRVLDPDVGSSAYDRAKRTMTPAGITAKGNDVVRVQLRRPDSMLPVLLARPHFSIIPAGVDSFSVKTAMGTGPFKLKSWQAGRSWEVVRNPDYWEHGRPYLDGVREVVTAESAVRVQGVLTGEFQLAEEIDFASARSQQKSDPASLLTLPKGVNRVIVMDCSVEPFTDPRVVQAFKLAIDRPVSVNAVFQGFGVEGADITVPPKDRFFPTGLKPPAYDPERAKGLLAEAGHPNGIDIDLLTSQVFSNMPEMAVTFSQSAQSAGIRANVRQQAPDSYWDKVWRSKPFYTTYWATEYPPDNLWRIYSGPLNEAHLKIPEFSTLFDQILRTGDEQKQVSLTQEAHQIAAERWGHIIPTVVESVWCTTPKLRGVQGDPPAFRVRLGDAYLES